MSTDSKQLQQAKPDPAIGWVEANSPHLFLAFRQGSPMTQATSTITINAPPDVLWQVIQRLRRGRPVSRPGRLQHG